MDHFVRVDKLPDGLRFPADLADRIHYEPEARRLVHHGFMSKSEFDRLCALSDDWGYRRPLEDLFQLCTPDDPRPRAGWRKVLSAVGL